MDFSACYLVEIMKCRSLLKSHRSQKSVSTFHGLMTSVRTRLAKQSKQSAVLGKHFPFIVIQYCIKSKVLGQEGLGQGGTNLSCSLWVKFYRAIIAFVFGVLSENSQVTEYEMVVVNNAWQLKNLTGVLV